jgi:hypothetical protein
MEEAAYFKRECDRFGFGTGEEERDPQPGDDGDSEVVDDARSGRRRRRGRRREERSSSVGMRGGRFKNWMEAQWEREKDEEAMRSHPLWTTHEADPDDPWLGEDGEKESVEEGQGEGQGQELGEGFEEHDSVPLSMFLRPTRRHQLTSNSKVRGSADDGRIE